jgi:hypothetical protein
MKVLTSAVILAASMPALAASTVAYIYAEVPNEGTNVWAASSTGKLTLLKGFPFSTEGDTVGTNGTFFLTLNENGTLFSYKVESNGGLGGQVSITNTYKYTPSSPYCGTAIGAEFDHTGKYVYVSISGYGSGNTYCNSIQTFAIGKTGELTFKGSTDYDLYQYGDELGEIDYITGYRPTITGNGKFAFFADSVIPGNSLYNINTFAQDGSGTLNWQPTTETDPVGFSQSGVPGLMTDDPTNHLAMMVYTLSGVPPGNLPTPRIASYTVGSRGQITSTNTDANMPAVPSGITLMKLDPTGTKLAVATDPGVLFFHFNGANPVTRYPVAAIGDSGAIGDMAWDDSDHLYLGNYHSGRLHVYTVTKDGAAESPESPTQINFYAHIVVRSVSK